ncbi:MAG: cobyrinate a,c-diamide synthase [Bacillota bacterium]
MSNTTTGKPRLVIAGTHSGTGKTTLSIGLMAAFCLRGLVVQPFKVGPDYIDPGFHTVAAQRVSHNLDGWMLSEDKIREIYSRASTNVDLSLIEGVMGLFDGVKGHGELGSTAQVAKALAAPVILVINARGLARSAAAMICGYRNFDPAVNIAGVIFNNVGSGNHAAFLGQAADEAGMPVVGCLPRLDEFQLPERHLGLTPAGETEDLSRAINNWAGLIEEHLNLDLIQEIAFKAPSFPTFPGDRISTSGTSHKVPIALARDQAFNFYYQDALDTLEEAGAKLVPFSPLQDRNLPKGVAGIFLGGGFPEVFLPQLSSNHDLIEEIRHCALGGMPIYGECGGLMYLARSVTDFQGRNYSLAGVVPVDVHMEKKLSALGYVEATVLRDNVLARRGELLRGHEFHWSRIDNWPTDLHAYSLSGGRGAAGRFEGYAAGNILATYVHLHFRSCPHTAVKFLETCRRYLAVAGGEAAANR